MMGRVRSGALALLVLVLVLALVGCSSTSSSSPRSSPTSTPSAVVSCAWYTPTVPQGQQVILTATGSTCGAAAPVIEFAAERTRRVWYSTTLDFGGEATLIAQLRKGAVTVRVFQLGSGTQTMNTAGQLADDFAAAGWTPLVPTGPQGPAPSMFYSASMIAAS